MAPTKPRIIIHGGAGNITRANLPPASYAAYRAALLSILSSTNQLLTNGTSALDAATAAVTLLEDNPLFNCGRGAVFNRAGAIELEASVMVSRGYRKRGVGISLIQTVKNPIVMAREILVRGEVDGGGGGNEGGDGDPAGGSGGAQGHCFLSGATVEALARDWGIELCDEKWHWTKRRWDEHKRGLDNSKPARGGAAAEQTWEEEEALRGTGGGPLDYDPTTDLPSWDGHEYLPQGTVGCVCLDAVGVLCVATSTGGLTNKLPGRIGDTPTPGAGFWAEEWPVPRLSPPSLAGPSSSSPLTALLTHCLPPSLFFTPHYSPLATYPPDKPSSTTTTRAVAISGTGNGDSFLRLAAVRTAGAMARFAAPASVSLQRAVTAVAGPGGALQESAGDRWQRTGEGEGGIIGIEVVGGVGEVVWDFNCGGMFRAWVDGAGVGRMDVFRGGY